MVTHMRTALRVTDYDEWKACDAFESCPEVAKIVGAEAGSLATRIDWLRRRFLAESRSP